MRISSSTEYSTRLMVALARRHGQAAVSADSLSESENVPEDYVKTLLWRLKAAGLVRSFRGTSGGYALAKPPAEITLGLIVRAAQGEIFESVCGRYEGGDKDCRHQSRCGISPVWKRLGEMVESYFDSVRLADLLEPDACPVAVLRAPDARP